MPFAHRWHWGTAPPPGILHDGWLGVWLLPRLDSAVDFVLVLAYMTAISLMVATAAGTRGGPWRYAAVAASMFYASDNTGVPVVEQGGGR